MNSLSTATTTPRLPPRRPQAVVFDMDGLMLDTERLDRSAWRAAMQRRGAEFTDEMHAQLIGRRAVDTERLLRAHYGAGFPYEAVRAEAKSACRAHIAMYGIPHKAGLLELLDHLDAAGIPKAIATSTARAQALANLGALAARFVALVCGDEVARGKPAPDIYLQAAERLALAPADCLALEDSPAGVTAADAAGMAVVMIPDLVQPSVPPRYLCSSLADVTAWLRSAGGR